MAFDQARYEREVIGPMRGRRGRLTDDDLLRRYAIEPGMDRDALQAHLRKVRTYWNQRAGGPDGRAQVCKQLLTADQELQRREGAKLLDPAWWQAQAQRQDQAAQAAIGQLAGDLARAYGALGLVTRTQLTAIAGHYASLTPEQLTRAAQQAKVRVVDAADLPTSSGVDRIAYRDLVDRLAELGLPTIVQLLHPDLARPFTLVERFAVPGEPDRQLSLDVVQRRRTEAEKAADSPAVRARKAALGVLFTGLTKHSADLRVVALFHVVQLCAAERAKGVADVLLVRLAVGLGIEQHDAELLVASLPSTVEAGSSAAAQVRELLATGHLRAAQQAVAAIPVSDPERTEVAQAVQQRETEVRRLLDELERASRDGRDEEAERLLREAARLAADDADLATRLERHPPPPPRDVRVVAQANHAKVSWRAPDTVRSGLRYSVTRNAGRAPVDRDDGARVGDSDGASIVDSSAPAGQEIVYAVFTGAGDTWSRPALAKIRLVPPIGEVTLRVRPDEITASWTPHPDAASVKVCRRQGTPPAGATDGEPVTANVSSFVDRSVREGVEYFYGLVALYHDEQRRPVSAPMTVVSASPRAAGQPLDGLSVEPQHAGSGGARVARLRWPARYGQIRIRYGSSAPTWEFGETVTVASMERYGQEVLGAQVLDGEWMVLDAEVPVEPQVYVPFTVGGTGAVVGRAVHVSHAEPVRQLHVRRTGDRALLTWIWPDDARLVEIRWEAPGVPAETTRISHAQYVKGNGCVLRVGSTGGTATVWSVAIGPSRESLSAPVSVSVDGPAIRLSYRMRRPSSLRDRLSRRRVVELRADQDCADVDITIVVSAGLAMPVRVDKDMAAFRFQGLRFQRESTLPLEFEIPAKTRRPYWIRCFVLQPTTVTLVDPPITELKVS
jgi:hypothetical protein